MLLESWSHLIMLDDVLSMTLSRHRVAHGQKEASTDIWWMQNFGIAYIRNGDIPTPAEDLGRYAEDRRRATKD